MIPFYLNFKALWGGIPLHFSTLYCCVTVSSVWIAPPEVVTRTSPTLWPIGQTSRALRVIKQKNQLEIPFKQPKKPLSIKNEMGPNPSGPKQVARTILRFRGPFSGSLTFH